MLTSLSVRQFALMREVHLDLDGGMTVFTGETGAGKSILIDALGAAFGARASADWVRHGAERAEVTAVFSPKPGRPLQAQLEAILGEADIECEDELILRRVIGRDGRSRAYVNSVPVSLKLMQRIGSMCLDLHGQHEHQALLQPEFQRGLLDAGIEASLLEEVKQSHDAWRQAVSSLKALQQDRGDTEQRAAWMREELERLDALGIEQGLAERLQAEVESGRHHAQIQQSAAEAMQLLEEGEPSVRSLMARAGHALDATRAFHPGLETAAGMLEQMDAILGELGNELRQVSDAEFDETALQAAEERLMRLHEAMRRHDCDEAGLLSLMQDWREKLSALDTAAWDELALTQACEDARRAYLDAANRLSEARRKQAEVICERLRPVLDRLALAGMQVRFDIEPFEDESGWRADGRDAICMLLMSNPGEPWRPLASVASGGELSRLVLALKGSGVVADMPPIAVFDEVDTGIGGETAWCVGQLLAAMGRERQVLVISHLAQVAACADHHRVIRKAEQDGRMTTEVEAIAEDARQPEIARMLGGQDAEALKHAARLLRRGAEERAAVG